MSRILDLDPAQPADVNGFQTMQSLVIALEGADSRGWRVMGGWMVRAYSAGGSLAPRPTTDVDLSLFPSRVGPRGKLISDRLGAAGFRAGEEPFKLFLDDQEIDLLVPPGGSRSGRIGRQAVFEADGTAFAFELGPEPLDVRLGDAKLKIQTARLAAALVAKAVLFGMARPKSRADAVDVGLLLSAVARSGGETHEELRAHRKRSDVRSALRVLEESFVEADGRGILAIRDQRSLEEALTAAANARGLLARR